MSRIPLPWLLVAALTVFCLVPLPTAPALAQQDTVATAAEEVSTKDLKGLVETLENPDKRAELVKTLNTLIAARESGEDAGGQAGAGPDGLVAQAMDGVSRALGRFSEEMAELGRLGEDIPAMVGALRGWIDSEDARRTALSGGAKLAAVVAAWVAVGWIVRRLVARPRRRFAVRGGDRHWVERGLFLLARLMLDLMAPLAAAGVAWMVLATVQAGGDVRTGAVMVVAALAAYQIVMTVVSGILSPDLPDGRVFPMTGETAHYLTIWSRRLAGIVVFGVLGLQLAALGGVPAITLAALTRLLGLIVTMLVVMLVLQNRKEVAAWLRQGTEAPMDGEPRRRTGQRLRQRFADVWHVLAVLYAVAFFVVWVADMDDGFAIMLRATAWTAVIVVVAVLIGHLLRLGMDRLFEVSAEKREQHPALEKRANRYLPLLHTVLRGFVWVVAALAVLQAWGLDTLVWLTEGAGQRLARAAVTISIVIGLALVVWEMTSSWIERYLSARDGNGETIQRSARAKTLLPLARNVLLVVLIIFVGLIVLSEIGVNIAPLLAGAGVVGLAIGFGSQKLVQDVITGAFILFEDAIAVGDVVSLSGHAGVVEGMTIRSLRLRDLSGNVHTIPFSSVDTLTNMTKDYSYALLEVGVAYREDTDEVCEVLKELCAEMRAEPEYAARIWDDLEILGVDKFADSAVVIKVRIMTQPGEQWGIGREFRRRMKKAFDSRGIEIPFPHTTLYFGEDKDGKAPPARVVVRERRAAAQTMPPREDGLPDAAEEALADGPQTQRRQLPDPGGD